MPGIFVLTARQNGKMSSVKMVNKGNGTRNGIEYMGPIETLRATSPQTKSGTRYVIHRPFASGDEMEYVGYTYVNGTEIGGSLVIRQQQVNSEEIVFNLIVPVTNPNDGQPCENTPTLTDVEGNTYNTVQIGNQCWMKENLRTTKYADNTEIALFNGQTDYQPNSDVPYRFYPGNSLNNVNTYGYLYNWNAAMGNFSSSHSNPSGVQGICPTGWHVPSGAEWTQLTDYVSSRSAYRCGDSSWGSIDKALASTEGWSSDDLSTSCYPGYEPSSNNATGFSALPAGCFDYFTYYHFDDNWFQDLGHTAIIWISTALVESNYSYYTIFPRYHYEESISYSYATDGFSVRCLRD